jgi:hypothetical protein
MIINILFIIYYMANYGLLEFIKNRHLKDLKSCGHCGCTSSILVPGTTLKRLIRKAFSVFLFSSLNFFFNLLFT